MNHEHHHRASGAEATEIDQRADAQSQHRMLDLDAEVFADNLTEVLSLAGRIEPHLIVDLGAGTGTGSRLLRERYPAAGIVCVDKDPQMLEALAALGFAVLEADLDDGFPVLDGLTSANAGTEPMVDMVWASSSLHHVITPARLLSEIHGVLAPQGCLIVVELAALPSFFADPAG